MKHLLRYRYVIYVGTVLTGLTGLVYQVIWQKYLAFVVGSETRSVSLVVTVFLAGLAAGYQFWGRRSEGAASRRKLLRVYGFIELGIGLYAALFPWWLKAVAAIGHSLPSGLLTDLLLSLLALLAPTFLMGATIPLLVSVVPETVEEVHLCHAKIYGVNTLGACLGAFGASFWLIPRLGLQDALLAASAINFVVGTIFVLNPLRDAVSKKDSVEAIPHRFPLWSIYLFTLVTGTVTLSLEVLFVRVLGLTVGSGPHNFAIVVGIFILGLAIGSLSLTGRLLTVRVLFRSIVLLSLYLMVLFHSVSYWPYWLNNVRSAMRSLPVNYYVYMVLVTGFLALVLLPFLIPMGRLLPLVYGLIPKSGADYGKKCGRLYYYNTVGTALGAIVLSYLSLYLLDLDQVYKLNVALLVAVATYLLLRERRLRSATVLCLAAVLFLAGPGWDRASHYIGLFRSTEVEPFNFQGWFQKPQIVPRSIRLKDGPDATVSVNEHSYPYAVAGPDGRAVPLTSMSFSVNGKADGDTLTDYSTNMLAALLPYLYGPQRSDLQATVVGLGTGMTAGLLAQTADVERVTVVEISSTLIDVMPDFAQANYRVAENDKVAMLGIDGFKYFNQRESELDIVVSATSPPWVVGVENLFTPEFYRLVHDALRDDGVFLQWFPLFTMNDVQFRTILSNMQESFPHRRLYRISLGEMAVLAARSSVPGEPNPSRFGEAVVGQVFSRLQVDGLDQLRLIDLFDDPSIDFVARSGERVTHTLAHPQLAYISDRLRFITQGVDWQQFIDPRVQRLAQYSVERRAAFESMLKRYPFGQQCTDPTLGSRLFCSRYQSLWDAHSKFAGGQPGAAPLPLQLEAYETLRQEGMWPADATFLESAVEQVAERLPMEPEPMSRALERIFIAYANDGQFEEYSRALARLRERQVIPAGYHDRMQQQFQTRRQGHLAFMSQYRGS